MPTIRALGGGLLTVNGGAVDLAGGNALANGLSGGTGGIITNSLTATAGTLSVNEGGAINNNTFSGTIQDGPTGGSAALALVGTGTLSLRGTNNTYTGGTFLNNGVLNFSPNALSLAGNGLNFGGGTLQWAPGNTQDVSPGIASILAGQNAVLDIGANNVTLSSSIAGSGGLTKFGSGRLTLGAMAYSGTNTINAGTLLLVGPNSAAQSMINGGTLQVGNGGAAGSLAPGSAISTATSGTLAFNRSDTYTLGALNVSGSIALTQLGPGTLVLSSSTGYGFNAGPVTTNVNAGILQFATANALYDGNTASWTSTLIKVSSGATLAVNYGGPNDFTSAQVDTLVSSVMTNNPGNLGFDTSNAPGGSVAYSSSIGANTGGIVKTGTGTLVLNNNSVNNGYQYKGPTIVYNGELALAGTNNASITVASVMTAANSLRGARRSSRCKAPRPWAMCRGTPRV